ncbi:MAG: DUF3788 family protein [Methanobacterium sp.]
MEERPFVDKTNKPDNEKLKNSLKSSYGYYKELIDISDSFLKDWNFSKSSGCMLKVHDKNKALFYVIPLYDKLKITMAIRENELNALLEDNKLESS